MQRVSSWLRGTWFTGHVETNALNHPAWRKEKNSTFRA
ncbi:unnamed protein product [Brassica napus]|uniref:(rape) hypothetical protein n=1 Tax=Brassica napus TaxID=3708 RepID=A0A816ZF83_BRANA|nr:unnamed protein product [Brassica napus]